MITAIRHTIGKYTACPLFLLSFRARAGGHGPALGSAEDGGDGAGGRVGEEGRGLGRGHEIIENLCLPSGSLEVQFLVVPVNDVV